jgi:CBS domain-containing protein
MKTVQEVMARMPETARPHDTIHKAAQMMRDGDYGSLPIIEAEDPSDTGMLVGIVTDRDIVLKAVAEGRGGDTPLSHCMTTAPDTVGGDTPLEQALIVMTSRQIHRLPVLENGRLIGMISLADIAGEVDAEKLARAFEDISAGGERRPAGTAFDS